MGARGDIILPLDLRIPCISIINNSIQRQTTISLCPLSNQASTLNSQTLKKNSFDHFNIMDAFSLDFLESKTHPMHTDEEDLTFTPPPPSLSFPLGAPPLTLASPTSFPLMSPAGLFSSSSSSSSSSFSHAAAGPTSQWVRGGGEQCVQCVKG